MIKVLCYKSVLNFYKYNIIAWKMYNIKSALLMFSSSLKMTKIDQNTLGQIVCKKYNFDISAFVCFSV